MFAAATLQAAVGFAAAMFAIPLLFWAGNDLMSAQVMVITAMLPQNILGVYKLRESVTLKEVTAPALVRIAAIPIGIIGLTYVRTWSEDSVNQFVAVLILLAVASQAFIGVEWKNAKRWYWVVVTFGGSGILQGVSGISGPPMVLWVHGQRYSACRARAFLFAMYISNFLPQILLLIWSFGGAVWKALFVAVLAIPLVLVGASLGLKIGAKLGDDRLRPLSYIVLVAMAVYSLLAPWWS
ncbi:MAG: TSUP family transporter [Planctomycetota bacterium]